MRCGRGVAREQTDSWKQAGEVAEEAVVEVEVDESSMPRDKSLEVGYQFSTLRKGLR